MDNIFEFKTEGEKFAAEMVNLEESVMLQIADIAGKYNVDIIQTIKNFSVNVLTAACHMESEFYLSKQKEGE